MHSKWLLDYFKIKAAKSSVIFFFFYQIILCFYLLFRFTLFPHCSVKKRKVSIRFGQDSVCYCMNIVKQDCGYKSDPLLYSISQWGRLHLCKEVHWADRGTRYSSASERQVRSFLFLYFNKVNVSTGITTVGLYRTGGVNSKVQRLMTSVFGLLLLFWSDSHVRSEVHLCFSNHVLPCSVHSYFWDTAGFRCLGQQDHNQRP